MPDENKFAKLSEVGYTVLPCCGLCAHGTFPGGLQWGTCGKHNYKHKKHTGDERQMSIHVFGHCDDYAVDDDERRKLQSFDRFFDDPRMTEAE